MKSQSLQWCCTSASGWSEVASTSGVSACAEISRLMMALSAVSTWLALLRPKVIVTAMSLHSITRQASWLLSICTAGLTTMPSKTVFCRSP